jgi:hypothetical protein
MDSSFSPKEEVWFLRVCHHISNAVYIEGLPSAKSNPEFVEMEGQAGQERDRAMGLGWNVLKATVHMQPNLRSRCRNERGDECEERIKKRKKRAQGNKD